MLYDAYEKKIRKRYKYFKLIHKFRILIMAIILMAVSLTTTFMITKGMVYGVEYDESINYGDEIKISSSSFMSDYAYSYSKVGSDNFTKQVPQVPGDYQIKVTTKGIFNNNREKLLPFTIKERDIQVEINLDEVEFGMNPYDFNIDLPYDDYIADIEFDYTSPGEKISEIKLRSIKINNKHDEDVTSFYNINHTAKVVEFVERKITVELLSYQSTYDALVHTSNKFGITNGSLVDGHYLVMETTGEIQTVGEVNNKIKSITIYDENDVDVTSNYEITQVDSNSKLKLDKRDLTLSLTDKEQVYNAKALTNNEFNYSVDELLSGHEVTITTTGSITNYIKDGITNNIDKVTILDHEGNDVTDNYNIVKKSGNLKIIKYIIEVTTGSSTHIYNGLEYLDKTFEYDRELFGDDKFFVKILVPNTNVGKYINGNQISVLDENGIESQNYAINHTNGVIEIQKREITIELAYDEKTYDSKYFFNNNYTVTNESIDEGFALNHILSIQNNNHETMYINAGNYENIFDFNIVDENNVNVSDNYDITTISGELIINKREITIKTSSVEKIYDGEELFDKVITDLNLAENDDYNIESYSKLINVDSIENAIEISIYRRGTNEDVLSNYEIEYEFGKLTVNKRPIHIKLEDDNKIYDGIKLENKEFDYTNWDYLILPNEDISYQVESSITNVGEEVNVIVEGSIKITKESGEDSTLNYDISVSEGLLTITKRPIIIKPEFDTRVYDGTIFTSNKAIVSESSEFGLVLDHFINITTDGERLNVGLEGNSILSHDILDLDNYNHNDNYEVDYESDYIEVTPRPITIQSNSESKVYDGLILSNLKYKILEGSIVDGETLVVSEFTEITDVKKVDNVLEYEIYNKDKELFKENYNITRVNGELEITPRTIRVKPEDKEKVYDSLPLFNYAYEHEYINSLYELVLDHILEIETDGSITNVSKDINNITNYLIFDTNGIDKTNNYNVLVETGTLEVTPRQITIRSGSSNKVYDGLILSNIEYEILEGDIVGGETLVVSAFTEITNAKKVDNELEYEIYNKDYELFKENYNITRVHGELEITHRNINIKGLDKEKVYDGLPLYNEKKDYEYLNSEYEIVAGHVLEIETSKSIIDAGFINDNEIIDYKIFKDGLDVTSNYYVTKDKSSLQIYKRTLIVKPIDKEKVYDGLPLFNKENEYEYVNSEYELVFGDTLEIDTDGKITDVDSIINNITGFRVYNVDRDVKDNYELDVREGKLTIVPREIRIKPEDKEKVYDGLPLFNDAHEYNYINSVYELVLDHILEIETDGKITNVSKIKNNITNYLIFDTNGIDKTHNYTVLVETGTLEITPRPITIRSGSLNKVYDGLILSNLEHEILEGSIVDGETLVVSAFTEITNVKKVDNVLEYEIYNKDKELFKENYDITRVHGTLEITPRNITIKTASGTKVYDAKYYYLEEFEVTGLGIVDGQTINIKNENHKFNYINVGTYDNIIEFEIYDIHSNNVTSNYEIDYVYGDLTITIRNLDVKTSSEEREYTGEPLYNADIDFINGTEIPNNDYYEVLFKTSVIEVGEYENKVIIEIYGNDGRGDTTSNYKIRYFNGTLKITQVDLHIKPEDKSKIYDGLWFYNKESEYEYVNEENVIPQGYTLEIETSEKIINVNKVDNKILSVKIYNIDKIDVTKNFNIIVYLGELEIKHREINLKPKYEFFEYDGTEHTATDIEVTNLVEGHEVVDVVFEGSRIDVGTETIIIISYDIVDENGDSVKENYDVILEEGEIEVGFPGSGGDGGDGDGDGGDGGSGGDGDGGSGGDGEDENKHLIEFKAKDVVFIYDGTEKTSNLVEMLKGNLINGHEIRIFTNGKITNVGSIKNEIIDYIIYDTINDRDVTSNYNPENIQLNQTGIITVVNKELTIETSSDTKIYGDESLNTSGYSIISGKLVTGHSLRIDSGFNVREAGRFLNNTTYKVLDENNDDVTDNYNINYLEGTLNILIRDIKIQVGTANKIFDANYIDNFEYEFVDGTSLAYDDELITSMKERIRDVGFYNISLNYIFKNIYGDDITTSYNVIEYEGKLEIFKASLTLESLYENTIYEDNIYVNVDIIRMFNDKNININLALKLTNKNIGTYKLIELVDYSIMDIYGDITKNIGLIINDYNEIVVIKREVSIKPKDKIKEYDGSPLYNLKDEIDYINSLNKLVDEHRIEITTNKSISNVGKITNNEIIDFEIYDRNNIKVTDNYDVNTFEGTLEITKIKIIVETLSNEKVYDDKYFYYDEMIIKSTSKLPDTQELYIKSFDHHFLYKNAGNYFNKFEIGIREISDKTDVTDNYDLTIEFGTLTIHRRKITIKPTYASKEYDGTELTSNLVEDLKTPFEILSKHRLDIETLGSIINVGIEDNIIISYEILNEDNESVKDNYDVTVEKGILEIIGREITIKTGDINSTYNGEYHYNDEYEIISGKLVSTDRIIILPEYYEKYFDAVVTNNEPDFIITDNDENIITNNYIISYEYGLVVINKRVITLETEGLIKEYDGEEHFNKNILVISGSLADQDYINVTYHPTIVDAGTKENILEYNILNREHNDRSVKHNYDIQIQYNNLVITKRDITIKPEDLDVIYDGLEKVSIEIVAISGSLADGETIKVEITGSRTNVGTTITKIIIDSIEVYKRDGITDSKSNYNIEVIDGEIVINKREIIVKPNDKEKYYDGIPLISENIVMSPNSRYDLVLDHEITGVISGSQTEVGIGTSRIDNYIIKDGSGRDVTDNYHVNREDGALEVLPELISIKAKDAKKNYDGTPLTSDIAEGSIELPAGFRIVITTLGSITDPGKIINEIDEYYIFDQDGNDVTDNYSIKVNEPDYIGTLIITQIIEIEIYRKVLNYDGINKTFTNTEYYYPDSSKRLHSDYVLEVIINGEITNVGTITSNTEVLGVYLRNDRTNNYLDELFVVEVIESTITVNKRKITVTAESASRVYDGDELTSDKYNITRGSLVLDHKLEAKIKDDSRITEIGKVANVIDQENTFIYDEDIDVTENYEITFIDGVLEVHDNNQILYLEEQLDLKFRKGFNLRENNSLK